MSGIGEASLVLGLISSIIAIYEGAHEVYEAASDVQGLPRKLRLAAEQIPLVLHALNLAEQNIKAKTVSVDTLQSARPIFERCKESAVEVKEIFDTTIPPKDASRTERYKKAVGIKLKSNKVKECMEEVVKNMELLAQHQVFQDADTLKDIHEAIEELGQIPDEEHAPQFVNSGGGPLIAHTGTGNVESYSHSGSGHIYTAKSQTFQTNPVHHHYPPPKKFDSSFQKPIGTCLGQVPCIDPELFIGRISELDAIKDILRPDVQSSKGRRLVIGGPAGIGKTQLAITYAQRHDYIYESVLWFDATSETTLKSSFLAIAEAIFDLSEPGFVEDNRIVMHVHQWLSDPKNTRWLLIYDNYDNPGLFDIQKYYPSATQGAIIVTTRRLDRVNGRKVRIQPIRDMDQSLDILKTRSGREGVKFDPAARRLAERLDGLPLALATAGAYLAQSTFTCERYLQEYECRWNIDPRRPLQLQEYQNRTLYTTWDLSYARLENEDPSAAKLLKLLAYFDNQDLWYELFYGGLTKDTPSWLREIISDDVEFDSAMGRLSAYCFLEVRASLGSWSMHTCVHDWTLAGLNRVIDVRQYWYTFDCVATSINEDNEGMLGHLNYARLSTHARWIAQDRFRENDLDENMSIDRAGKAQKIAHLLREQVQYGAAEIMCRLALTGYEKSLGMDHISTLDTVNNFGLLYIDQGSLVEAEQMFRRALTGYEQRVGVDHMSTLKIVHNFGYLYIKQGKLSEAEQMYRRALGGYEKTLGVDHFLSLATINNLGLVYTDQGKMADAEHMYRQALAKFEKALGVDHTSTLNIVNNLGLLYAKRGKLHEAEQMCRRALAGRKKAFGGNHKSTLDTVHNLGDLYTKQGKLAEAEQIFRQALVGKEKALGVGHTLTLDTINSLGAVYTLQGRLTEAEKMYRRALAGYKKALGDDHTSTLNTVRNLGILYANQDKFIEAEKMYRRALAGYKKALGDDHTSTLSTIDSLGSLYYQQGKLITADRMYRQALGGYEKALGDDHTSTLNTLQNLGLLCIDQDKFVEAEEMYQRALAGYEKAVGVNHISTISTINNLGILYDKQGKLTEAEQMYRRSLNGKEKALGPDHISTLTTVWNLGVLYTDQDRFVEAEQMYQRALAGHEKALGVDHTSTLSIVNNQGNLYAKQGKLTEAEQMYRRALAGREKALGVDHPSTLTSVRCLSAILASCAWAAKFRSTSVESQLPEKLQQLLQMAYVWGSRVSIIYGILGRALLWTSDRENARIAFCRQIVTREEDSIYAEVRCDGCGLFVSCAMQRLICEQCLDVDICGHCFILHESGGTVVSSCINHDFMKVTPTDDSSKPCDSCRSDEERRVSWLQDLITLSTSAIRQRHGIASEMNSVADSASQQLDRSC